MRKYLVAYSIALQETLQRRSTLLMDRLGGLAIVVSLYSFWSALMGAQPTFLGYTRAEMLTYVLLINVLRSLVFSTDRGWQMIGEISSGRISSYLVRPVSYHGYSLALDFSHKSVHVVSALFEIGILALMVRGAVFLPRDPFVWALFIAASVLSSLLFFFMVASISAFAFWTSESAGPLFCFELFLQFAAGAFFPLDVLPAALRRALEATPFPYMVYVPARIFLEKIGPAEAARTLALESVWLAVFAVAALGVWRRGLSSYSAEGG